MIAYTLKYHAHVLQLRQVISEQYHEYKQDVDSY